MGLCEQVKMNSTDCISNNINCEKLWEGENCKASEIVKRRDKNFGIGVPRYSSRCRWNNPTPLE
jgi:hypothetical protein